MVGDLAALGLHKVRGVAGRGRQPVRGRLRPARLRSEERFDGVARARVGGVAERQRRRGDDRSGRGGGRAGARRRRSAVALLHDRRARGHDDQRTADARRRHEGGARAHARQRRGPHPRGRRSAHVLPARRPAVAVPRLHAQAAARAPRDRNRRREGRQVAGAGPARPGGARLVAAGGGGPGSRTSGRTTSPPSSCCARWARRSAAVPATGTRASRPWIAT